MKNEFKKEYEELRRKAEAEAEERREAAYEAEPELKRIAGERREIVYRMGLAAAESGNPAPVREKALSAIRKLNDLESGILQKLGLPKDHLELRYFCKKCRDTGFIGNAVKKPCTCYLQRVSARDFASGCFCPDQSFENFDLNVFRDPRQRGIMKKARTICEQYADGLPNRAETQNLLLMGRPGLGKTYLVNCIALRALQRSVRVLKITSYHLIGRVLKAIREGKNVDDLMNISVLCVDDLGTEPMMTNVTREYIFSILNERLNSGLHTVFATNLSFESIQELYGERVFSRLVSPKLCKVLLLEGEDIRLLSK